MGTRGRFPGLYSVATLLLSEPWGQVSQCNVLTVTEFYDDGRTSWTRDPTLNSDNRLYSGGRRNSNLLKERTELNP